MNRDKVTHERTTPMTLTINMESKLHQNCACERVLREPMEGHCANPCRTILLTRLPIACEAKISGKLGAAPIGNRIRNSLLAPQALGRVYCANPWKGIARTHGRAPREPIRTGLANRCWRRTAQYQKWRSSPEKQSCDTSPERSGL